MSPASLKKGDFADYIARLADAILDAHRPGHMTLAIVNRVDRAQALRAAIEKRLSKRLPTAPTLALVHSRFRPADRERQMKKVVAADDPNPHGRIVVATQAVEAGVDISAAVLFTELAPWSSLVQRFGRANRYAELRDGADVRWIDLMPPAAEDAATDKNASELARPYEVAELQAARDRLAGLSDVAPVRLPPPDDLEPPRRVIRRKDLDDLFDTDPDLTGFDVDVSPYVRDAEDTGHPRLLAESRGAGRDEPPRPGRPSVSDAKPGSPASEARDEPPRPGRDELCAVSIAAAGEWVSNLPKKGRGLLFQRDPQWRRRDGRDRRVPARMDAAAGPALAGSRAPGRSTGRRLQRGMRIHRRPEGRARTDLRSGGDARLRRRRGPGRCSGTAPGRRARRASAEPRCEPRRRFRAARGRRARRASAERRCGGCQRLGTAGGRRARRRPHERNRPRRATRRPSPARRRRGRIVVRRARRGAGRAGRPSCAWRAGTISARRTRSFRTPCAAASTAGRQHPTCRSPRP